MSGEFINNDEDIEYLHNKIKKIEKDLKNKNKKIKELIELIEYCCYDEDFDADFVIKNMNKIRNR